MCSLPGACPLVLAVSVPEGEPGLGVHVRKAALGCAPLHSGLDQQAAGWSSWFASVLIWGGHGAGPGTPTSWGAWARETIRAGGVERSCVPLGSCSPSIYSSSPGEGTLADLGSQHGAPRIGPHTPPTVLKDWGKAGPPGRLTRYL